MLAEGDNYEKLKSNYKFDVEEFKNCLSYVIFVLNNPHYNNLGSVRRKFGSNKFHGVSGIKLGDFGVAYERLNGVIGYSDFSGSGKVEMDCKDRQF